MIVTVSERPWLEGLNPCGMRCLVKAGANVSEEWWGWLAFEAEAPL